MIVQPFPRAGRLPRRRWFTARAHLFRTQFHQYLTKSDLRAMVSEYQSIAEAILAGDEKKAETRMRLHIKRTGERTLPRQADCSLD